MRFSVAAVLAFAAAVIADVTEDFDSIYTPKAGSTIEAGKEFEVKWDVSEKYADGKVTIILIGGASAQTQVPIGKPIAVEVDNGAKSYKWQVASDLGDEKIYGLQFKLESNGEIYQYSPGFHIKKAEGSSTETGSETGSGTVTITTSQGAKTVTLSSTPVPTTTHHNTTTKAHNTTTYAKPTTSKLHTITTTTTTEPTTTAPAETSSSSAAAATMAAAAGGLLVALLAL